MSEESAAEASEPVVEVSDPESFNIFSEEASPIVAPSAEPAQEKPKSKEFLENLRRDKELRKRESGLKERENQARSQREEFEKFQAAKGMMGEIRQSSSSLRVWIR